MTKMSFSDEEFLIDLKTLSKNPIFDGKIVPL